MSTTTMSAGKREVNHHKATLTDVVRVAEALGVRPSELVWFADVLKSPALVSVAAERGVAPGEFLAQLVEFFGIAPGREGRF